MGNASPVVSRKRLSSTDITNVDKSEIISMKIKLLVRLLQKHDDLRALFVDYVMSRKWMQEMLSQVVSQRGAQPSLHDVLPARQFYHLPTDDYLLVHSTQGSPSNRFFDQLSVSSSERQSLRSQTTRNTATTRYSLTWASIGESTSSHSTHSNHIMPSLSSSHSNSSSMRDSLRDSMSSQPRDNLSAQWNPQHSQLLLCGCIIPLFLRTTEYSDWTSRNNNNLGSDAVGIAFPAANDAQHHSPPKSKAAMYKDMFFAHTSLLASHSNHQMDDGNVYLFGEFSSSSDSKAHSGSPSAGNKLPSLPLDTTQEDQEEGEDPNKEDTQEFESYLLSIVSEIDPLHLHSKLSTGSLWLRDLLIYLHELPFAISISSAKHQQTTLFDATFPLVFVNRAFLTLTGYPRHEVLGRNCRFLQREDVTEMNQVGKIRDALREGCATKVAVTNVRRDGTAFFNLLALQPVVRIINACSQSASNNTGSPSRAANSTHSSPDLQNKGRSQQTDRRGKQKRPRQQRECQYVIGAQYDLHTYYASRQNVHQNPPRTSSYIGMNAPEDTVHTASSSGSIISLRSQNTSHVVHTVSEDEEVDDGESRLTEDLLCIDALLHLLPFLLSD